MLQNTTVCINKSELVDLKQELELLRNREIVLRRQINEAEARWIDEQKKTMQLETDLLESTKTINKLRNDRKVWLMLGYCFN